MTTNTIITSNSNDRSIDSLVSISWTTFKSIEFIRRRYFTVMTLIVITMVGTVVAEAMVVAASVARAAATGLHPITTRHPLRL